MPCVVPTHRVRRQNEMKWDVWAATFRVAPGSENAKTALRRLLRPVAHPFLSDRSGREVLRM